MPRRDDISSIMVIGSGPIVIGQACEFDYSGTQACRALSAEGYRVVLVNSNPATIMTDPEIADRTYIEPLVPEILEAVIARERPDALLPTLGGQTGLNLAMKLHEMGVLERYGVEMIGANASAIATAEDRGLFRAAMTEIGLAVPDSGFATELEEALEIGERVGFPVIVRPSYILGGGGTGIATDMAGLRLAAANGLDASPIREILIETLDSGLERVRARSDARPGRQLRDRVLDRELRPHGCPYGRFGYGRPSTNPLRRRVPEDAGRRVRVHPPHWR